MPADRTRGFLIAFVSFVAFVAVAVPAINILVDPFWRFDVVSIPGINAQRAQFASYARMAKPGVVCREQPTQVAIGTSRVEVGLDPKHPGWSTVSGPTYNLALAGSGLKEVLLTLQHAVLAGPQLKRAVVGLDFLMFNAHREAVVFGTDVIGFDEKRLLTHQHDPCLRSFLYDAGEFLGLRGLVHSYQTTQKQLDTSAPIPPDKVAWWLALYDKDGFRSHFQAMETLIKPNGPRAVFGTAQESAYTTKVWRPPPDERYCFEKQGQPNTFDVFREMVRFARRFGVDVRFYLEPLHARMMLALQDAGLWVQFEDWKRGVVEVLAEEARESRMPPFPVWDFSGFNSVTNEHVPAAGDVTTPVLWFWEPSHYKKETGDLILDRVLRHTEPGRTVPDDFGVKLTPERIESWIAETREAGRRYRSAEPEEAGLVTSIVNGALTGADGSNCGLYLPELNAASEALRRGDRSAANAAFDRAKAIYEADRRRAEEAGVPYREAAFESALKMAQSGRVLPPKLATWQAYQERGIKRAKNGDLIGAAEDYAVAIRIGPANPALHFLRGTTLLAAGDGPGAAGEFEAGLKLDPTNAPLAQLLERARELSTRSSPARIDAGEAATLQQVADALRARGDLAGAIGKYGDAIAKSPPNTALHFLRGTALLEKGASTAAALDFEEGLKLEPSNATLQKLLQQARTQEARPALTGAPDLGIHSTNPAQ